MHLAGPESSHLEIESRKTLQLQSLLRMVQDQIRAAGNMVPNEESDGVPVVALSSLCRAAIMLIRLSGVQLPQEDIDGMRDKLRGYGKRWTVGRLFSSIRFRDFSRLTSRRHLSRSHRCSAFKLALLSRGKFSISSCISMDPRLLPASC